MSKVLVILNDFESSGMGFFNRNSDNTFTVWIRSTGDVRRDNRGEHWQRARDLETCLGRYARETEFDQQSGHIRMIVKGDK